MSSRQCLLIVAWLLAYATLCNAQHDNSHSLLTRVLHDHVANGAVDYSAIQTDRRFAEYLASLRRVDPFSIKNQDERLAFWINVYNAFTLKLIIDRYPVKSIRDIQEGGKGPWDIVWIDIAEDKYSLNQIEHQVIRKQFEEPRIHFALVCAAKSCPPLRSEAYVGKKLDKQLEDNAKKFLNDVSKNRFEKATDTLYLSELFSWYGDDFVKRYGSASNFAMTLLGVSHSQPVAVKYLPYDWGLNSR
ncbi:MAG: DUF547 domain-containing protein [Bacteroidota bacterium]